MIIILNKLGLGLGLFNFNYSNYNIILNAYIILDYCVYKLNIK